MDTPPNKPNKTSSKFGIRSKNVILEESFEPCDAIILIQDGIIHDIIELRTSDDETIKSALREWDIQDYGYSYVFPGLIDINMHLNAGCEEDWE